MGVRVDGSEGTPQSAEKGNTRLGTLSKEILPRGVPERYRCSASRASRPVELAGQMANWASMRNVVAHFYPVLDLSRVYDSLDEIEQLTAFEAWIETDHSALQ